MNSVLGLFYTTYFHKHPAIIADEAISDSRITVKFIKVFITSQLGTTLNLFHHNQEVASVLAISVTSCSEINGISDATVIEDY